MKKKSKKSAFFRPRTLIGLVLCCFGVLLGIFAFSTLTGRLTQAASQNQTSGGNPTQTSQVPFLTMGTAPDVPQCRSILRQNIIDRVNAATEDPAVTFEKNRRTHPHMVEMPPTIDCASAFWRTMRTGPPPTVDANAINSRQYAAYSVFNSGPLAALVGTN